MILSSIIYICFIKRIECLAATDKRSNLSDADYRNVRFIRKVTKNKILVYIIKLKVALIYTYITVLWNNVIFNLIYNIGYIHH